MAEKIDKQALFSEKAGIEDLMEHLEEEYRKAEISDQNYEELKGNYRKRLEEIDVLLNPGKPRPAKAETKPREEDVAPKSKEDEEEEGVEEEEEKEAESEGEGVVEEKPQPEEKKEKKGGFFSKIMGGKKEGNKEDKGKEDEAKDQAPQELDLGGLDPSDPKAIEMLAAQAMKQGGGGDEAPVEAAPVASSDDSGAPKDIEIEKLKVMLDAAREGTKTVEESVTNLSEGLGELRSMVFQTEGSQKELSAKMEKLEDQVQGLTPQEIDKKLRSFSSKMEQADLMHEKFEKKEEDLSQKVNKIDQIMKSIGGVENLIEINKSIQQKLSDIQEALKYTERLAVKTEKIFMDMNKGLQDVEIYKTRQEALDDTFKEVLKNIDAIKVEMAELPTKKDLETLRSDVFIFQKDIEEIKKVIPVVSGAIPENIETLRSEKNNVLLLLDSLKEHFGSGVITKSEYEDGKRKSEEKIRNIDAQIKSEWESVKKLQPTGAQPQQAQAPDAAAKVEEKPTENQSGPVEQEKTQEKQTDAQQADSQKPNDVKQETKQEAKYKCEMCGETFQTGRAKGGHMSKHKNEQAHQEAEQNKETQQRAQQTESVVDIVDKLKDTTNNIAKPIGVPGEGPAPDVISTIKKLKEKM